jgi:choline dehydrogenase-like flavoprotein
VPARRARTQAAANSVCFWPIVASGSANNWANFSTPSRRRVEREGSRRLPYQSTYNTGGVIIGADPATSAANNYLQMWDAPNVFVVGACNFPQNAGFNPTGTVGALAYRAAEGIPAVPQDRS